jgi:enoyl-CoA hydratase/carnithine racemase
MSELLRTCERGILRVTLNRPEKRNALSRAVLRELKTVFEANADLPDLRLAVLTAAGDAAFCAGGDLRDLGEIRSREDTETFAADATAALDAIRLFPVPTVAALNGVALGGGAELALACDMRIAAADARIGFVHATLNISTAWGGGADLMRLVGYGRAIELLAAANVLGAEEARALGILNRVAEPGESFAGFIEAFVAPMRERVPDVMRAIKAQAIGERLARPVLDRRAADEERFVATWASPAHWAIADRILK